MSPNQVLLVENLIKIKWKLPIFFIGKKQCLTSIKLRLLFYGKNINK